MWKPLDLLLVLKGMWGGGWEEKKMGVGRRISPEMPPPATQPPPSLSAIVRRLQLREELDRSSCGNVLFNGYLPPPGGCRTEG